MMTREEALPFAEEWAARKKPMISPHLNVQVGAVR
jgi:hypothetical protein